MQLVTISSKRQITIPKRYLEELDFSGKAMLDSKNGELTIKPVKSSVIDQLAGSLNHLIDPVKLGVPFKVAKKKAMEEMVKELANKYDLKNR